MSNIDKKKEKNGAHTHVCTTVQLGERNIHVGCCLFSHDQKNTKPKHKKDGMLIRQSSSTVLC